MVLKNLLQAVVHRQRKEPTAHPSIYRLLLPSCLTIMLTTACFMTATWGWFTANQSAGVSKITAGLCGGANAYVTTTTLTTTVTAYTIAPTTAPSEEQSGDTGVETVSLLHFDPAPTSNTAESSSETESTVPASTSETETTYETTDLTLNDENEWVFHATANQNHHFLVETEGNAKGFVQVTIEEDPAADGTENCTLYGYVDGTGTVEFNLLLSVPCTVTISTSWGSPADPGDDIIPTEASLAMESESQTFSLFGALESARFEVPTYGCGTQEEIVIYKEVIIEAPVQPETPVSTPETPVSTPETPVSTPETPPSTPETPATTPKTPASTPETPTSTPETPASTPETPATTPETPATTPETPASTPETPASTPVNNGSMETTAE